MDGRAMGRREFVKASAVVAAGGALASPSAARHAFVGGRDSLRVGVVGCGGRGTGAVVQALRADPSSILWSMGDAFAPRIESCLSGVRGAMEESDEHAGDGSRAFRDKVQVGEDRVHAGFDAYQRVIDSGVDVVILTTPPAFRPEHLAAAVAAGKHVFCEKPVAVDGPGVRSVLESARKAREQGTSLMSGFCWRYKHQCRELFERIHAGGVGDVLSVTSTYNTTGWMQPRPRQPEWTEMEWRLRNWHYATWLSGDHIVEQAVHAIDWIHWAFRDTPPDRCVAVGGRMTRPDLPETGNVYDNFAVTYEFPGGARAHHMCRHWPNTPSDNTMYLQGTKGRTHMNPWSGNPHEIMGESPWRGEAPNNDMYQQEHDELFAAIRAGKPVNDGVSMTHSTLMAIMGRMAAYTGEVVTWEQALNSQERLTPEAWAWGDAPACELAIPGKTRLA